jgi:putative flippase GtrA
MQLTSLLPERVRHLGPEVLAFGVIGAANTLLYMGITYVAMGIGVVKANVLATVITTTIAYFANRHWTYRHHSRSRRRREYTLFFGFNLIGLLIQSGAAAIAKYGFGLTEQNHKIALMVVTMAGIAVATVFRFWAYRTFVFLKPKADTDLVALDATAGLAEVSAELHDEAELKKAAAAAAAQTAPAEPLDDVALEAELIVEADAQRRATRR